MTSDGHHHQHFDVDSAPFAAALAWFAPCPPQRCTRLGGLGSFISCCQHARSFYADDDTLSLTCTGICVLSTLWQTDPTPSPVDPTVRLLDMRFARNPHRSTSPYRPWHRFLLLQTCATHPLPDRCGASFGSLARAVPAVALAPSQTPKPLTRPCTPGWSKVGSTTTAARCTGPTSTARSRTAQLPAQTSTGPPAASVR